MFSRSNRGVTPERVDVFVSYAHVDDVTPRGADKGWVSTFVAELQNILHRRLGHDDAWIWMDHELAAGDHINQTLMARARTSRTMLVVMSPAYQRSDWCNRELGSFVSASAAESSCDAVFIVETEPVDRGQWHPAIQPLKSIRFWERSPYDRAPRLLGYPVPTADENSQWWRNVNELAHLIADRLAHPARSIDRRTVWIADPTDDLLDECDRLAATLRQHGFEPVPSAPYPRQTRAAFEQALRADLDRAALLIQLFGPNPGRAPAWSAEPIATTQAAAALEVSRQRQVPLLKWRPRHVRLEDIADERYRELVTGVETSSIEEFRQRVLRVLLEPAEPDVVPARTVRHRSSVVSSPYIVVNADLVDRDLARDVQMSLVQLGVDVALAPEPSPNQTPQEIRLAQEEQLHSCDGVILVYGRTPAKWVQSQFAFSRKVLAQRRRGVWGALLDGPPNEKPEAGLRSPNLLLLNCRTGLDPSTLEGFVSALLT